MYFEYRDIFRYFSESWIKSKLKKVERRNVKSKHQNFVNLKKNRQNFFSTFQIFLKFCQIEKKIYQIVFIILSNCKKKKPSIFLNLVESIFVNALHEKGPQVGKCEFWGSQICCRWLFDEHFKKSRPKSAKLVELGYFEVGCKKLHLEKNDFEIYEPDFWDFREKINFETFYAQNYS